MCVCGRVLAKALRAFDEREAPGVGVGIDEDKLARRLRERGEEGIGLGVGVAQNRDRVPCGQHRGRREREPEPGFQSGAIKQRGAAQVIERGRAGMMHAPRLLAHGNHAVARGRRRGEVNVRHLGERVAHLVVDGALR